MSKVDQMMGGEWWPRSANCAQNVKPTNLFGWGSAPSHHSCRVGCRQVSRYKGRKENGIRSKSISMVGSRWSWDPLQTHHIWEEELWWWETGHWQKIWVSWLAWLLVAKWCALLQVWVRLNSLLISIRIVELCVEIESRQDILTSLYSTYPSHLLKQCDLRTMLILSIVSCINTALTVQNIQLC